MAQLQAPKRLRREDFDSEYQNIIDKIAFVINSFQDDVFSAFDGNIDFNNLSQIIKTINVKMGTDGSPQNELTINTGTTKKIQGIMVIAARRTDLTNSYPTSTPFMSFDQKSQSIIKINNISGLQDSSEYTLTIVLIT